MSKQLNLINQKLGFKHYSYQKSILINIKDHANGSDATVGFSMQQNESKRSGNLLHIRKSKPEDLSMSKISNQNQYTLR